MDPIGVTITSDGDGVYANDNGCWFSSGSAL